MLPASPSRFLAIARLGLIAHALAFSAVAAAPALDPKHEEFFEKEIRPLLEARCLECHSNAHKVKGELLLDSKAGWMAGGLGGPAIVPGKPDESPLIDAVRYHNEDLQMPPKGRLPDSEIALFEQWVAMGAPDPREGGAVVKKGIDLEEGRKFWAFRPLQKVEAPEVAADDWAWSEVDRFILAGLEKEGLVPAEDAEPAVLLRRLHFDLNGLPPSREEVAAFSQAWEKDRRAAIGAEVDKLLDRKAFGEKWGRHWLDLARYADSNGSSFNLVMPTVWRYRNWVIDAFNRNLPYDQFVQKQIAGDLLPWTEQDERDENLIATSFLMMGSKVLGEFDKEVLQMDVVDEQVDTVGKAMLGMTLGCARCHDHKFDPVSTADYYAMAGIFTSTQTLNGRVNGPKEDESDLMRRGLGEGGDERLLAFMEDHRHEWQKAMGRLYGKQKDVARLERALAKAGGSDPDIEAELQEKQDELAEQEAEMDKLAELPEFVLAPLDSSEPADTPIRIRGAAAAHGDVVPRGFLSVASWEGQPQVNPSQSGRLELAQWLTAPENGLSARVFANRVWEKLFAEGIVRSVDNFGYRGDPPTHPELLGFLAREFVTSGFDIKALVREVATSRAYAMATVNHPQLNVARAEQVDPENRLLHRQNRRRLEPEEIRDTLLHLAGRLNREPRGPVVDHLPLTQVNGEAEMQSKGVEETNHRTVYQPVIRTSVNDLLEVFDFANPDMSTGKRADTTVAPQALYMMNSPFVQSISFQIAHEMRAEDTGRLIDEVFQSIVSRNAAPEERELIEGYFRNQYPEGETPTRHDVGKLCQAVIASTVFQYLD